MGPKARLVNEVLCLPDEATPDGRRLAAERDALLALSEVLSRAPESASQRLVELAMRLTRTGSAGLSLEDKERRKHVFRWIATCGGFAKYLGATMPRFFSPCGTAVDRAQALVMRDPGRHFDYIQVLDPPVRTAMLVPFARAGRYVGTLWVVAHTPEQTFTTEDVRVVQGLTTFVSAVLDAIGGKQGDKTRPHKELS
jgi:GAF domain-containing protein